MASHCVFQSYHVYTQISWYINMVICNISVSAKYPVVLSSDVFSLVQWTKEEKFILHAGIGDDTAESLCDFYRCAVFFIRIRSAHPHGISYLLCFAFSKRRQLYFCNRPVMISGLLALLSTGASLELLLRLQLWHRHKILHTQYEEEENMRGAAQCHRAAWCQRSCNLSDWL